MAHNGHRSGDAKGQTITKDGPGYQHKHLSATQFPKHTKGLSSIYW